jgi:Cupin domain
MSIPANLAEKLATFTDRFSPRTVATYNNNDIMVAKLEGPFHWHKHEDTDDFFLILKGTLDIELRDRTVTLNAGEVFCRAQGGRTPASCTRRSPHFADRADGYPKYRRQEDCGTAHPRLAKLPSEIYAKFNRSCFGRMPFGLSVWPMQEANPLVASA